MQSCRIDAPVRHGTEVRGPAVVHGSFNIVEPLRSPMVSMGWWNNLRSKVNHSTMDLCVACFFVSLFLCSFVCFMFHFKTTIGHRNSQNLAGPTRLGRWEPSWTGRKWCPTRGTIGWLHARRPWGAGGPKCASLCGSVYGCDRNLPKKLWRGSWKTFFF